MLWTARMALSSCRKAKNLDQKFWNGFRKIIPNFLYYTSSCCQRNNIRCFGAVQCSCETIQKYIWKLQNQQASFACCSGFSNRSNLANTPQESEALWTYWDNWENSGKKSRELWTLIVTSLTYSSWFNYSIFLLIFFPLLH